MSKYIDADKLIEFANNSRVGLDANDIARFPSADVVSRETFEQFKWERDTAVQQLEELGYGLGQKIVHCKDCKHRLTDECPMYEEHWEDYDDDGYTDHDLIICDRTVDDGFCYKGEPEE